MVLSTISMVVRGIVVSSDEHNSTDTHDLSTVTSMVEFLVVLTTSLLLAWFALGSSAPRRSSRLLNAVSIVVHTVSSFMVYYTQGLMQLSSRGNDLFQVWSVLIVTMQYSVMISSLYITEKDLTLVDLLSSLWAANLLQAQTALPLKVPLWLIWTLNAVRMVAYSSSSKKASETELYSTRLISNYMRREHTLSIDSADADPATMSGYKYLVLGDERQKPEPQASSFSLPLDLEQPELVTVERVWSLGGDDSGGLLGGAADPDNRLKEACLSFALFKLLRCRFLNFPMHEAPLPKTRRLVLDYILQEANSYERAFRVTEVELSFLRHMFYSKHVVMFANGFPARMLLLSLLLVAALGYLAYLAQRLAGTSHSVLITNIIIAIVVVKELWETFIYVFSQWTKVLIICHYVKRKDQSFFWCPVTEKAAGIMCKSITSGRWDQRIHQYNILLATRGGVIARLPAKIKLRSEARVAIFGSLRELLLLQGGDGRGLHSSSSNCITDSYLSNAFGTNQCLIDEISWAGEELDSDIHRILVWHVATCLCEISLSGGLHGGKSLNAWCLRPRPFVQKSSISTTRDGVWQHYVAAVSLSNYCAYLVTRSDHVLFARDLLEVVLGEARGVVPAAAGGNRSMGSIHDRLVSNAWAPDGPEGRSMIKMGAQLAEQLRLAYGGAADAAALWAGLGRFWAFFLLHLAASTRAAVHREHLRGHGELTTHLWALLCHAGFLGTWEDRP